MTCLGRDQQPDRKTALYQRFIATLGVTTPELQRLFAERLRCYSGHPKEVLALLGIPVTENAYALPVSPRHDACDPIQRHTRSVISAI